MTVSEFAAKLKLEYFCYDAAPNKIDGKTPFKYTVVIKYKGKEFSTVYTCGAAWVDSYNGRPLPYNELREKVKDARWAPYKIKNLKPRQPKISDVLYSLVMDSLSFEQNPAWENFAHEFGMDTDSRKHYATFEACGKIWGELKTLFGPHFSDFLKCEEDDANG